MGFQRSKGYPIYIDRCFGNPSTGAGSGMISNYRGTGNFSTLLRRLLKVSVDELFEKKSLLAFKATGFPDVPSPSPECSSCQSPGSRPSHLRPVSNTSYLGTQILTPPRYAQLFLEKPCVLRELCRNPHSMPEWFLQP